MLNGDVVTNLSLNSLISDHRRHGAGLTVATVTRKVRVDFGVIEESDFRVTPFREKPNLSHLVSMGVYCMEPTMLERVPTGIPLGFDEPDVSDARNRPANKHVPAQRFWLDVGSIEDFRRARELNWDHDVPAYETAPISFESIELTS